VFQIEVNNYEFKNVTPKVKQMKYKKKPVVVEAFQMTEYQRWNNADWPQWLHQAWNKAPTEPGALFCLNGGEQLYILTPEGTHAVTFGDFIIQGVQGELYPCKPDIFAATYDPVEDDA